jgi:hypothetical protein
MTLTAGADYLSGGERTKKGRRRYSPRCLAKQVALTKPESGRTPRPIRIEPKAPQSTCASSCSIRELPLAE